MYRKTPVTEFGQRNLPKPVEQTGRRANLLANALAEKQAREAEERRRAEAALRLKEQRAERRRQKALNAVRWPVEQTREAARKAAEPVHKLAKASEQAGERLVNLSKAANQAGKSAAKSLGDAGREAAQDMARAGKGIAGGISSAGKKAGKGIGGTATGITTGIGNTGKGIADGVRSAGKGAADGAKDFGKGIAGDIRLTGSSASRLVGEAGRGVSENLRDAGAITRLSLLNMGQDVTDGLRHTGREISGGLDAARLRALKTGDGITGGVRKTQRNIAENLRDAGDITRLTFLDVGQDISAGLRDRGREFSQGLDSARGAARLTGDVMARGLRDAHREVSQNLREAGEITRASFLDVGKDVTDGLRDRHREMSDGWRRARRAAGSGLLLAGQGIAAGWRTASGSVAANLRDAGSITHATFRDLGHDITEGGLDRLREARAMAELAARIGELGLRTVRQIDLSPVTEMPGHVSRRAALIKSCVDSGVRRSASGIGGLLVIIFMLPVRLWRVAAAAMHLLAVRGQNRWHAIRRRWRGQTRQVRQTLAHGLFRLRRTLAWSGVWLRPAAVAGMAILAVVYAGSVTTEIAVRQIFDNDETATAKAPRELVAESIVPPDVERHALATPPRAAQQPPAAESIMESAAAPAAVSPGEAPLPAEATKAADSAPLPESETTPPTETEQVIETQIAEAGAIPPADPREKPAVRRPAPPVAAGAVQVAIVIDDMGMDQRMLSRFVKLPGEITFAFLPYAPRLKSQTREARKAGHELIVHMPMEPKDAATDPGRNALLTGLETAELERRIAWNLDRFDGFVGINNHMGSKFTEDADSMSLVMAVLRQRGLIYLDSLTTSATSGYRLAGALGVPRMRRDVFLDNDQNVDSILRQLRETRRIAKVVGKAIAIGHPYPETLEALHRWIPEAQADDVRLVPISALAPATQPRVASVNAGQP